MKNTEALLNIIKEVRPETKTEKTKFICPITSIQAKILT
jgi:hypothetical protein